MALGTPGEGLVVEFMMLSELGSEFEPRALRSTTRPISETLAGHQLGTRTSLPSLRVGRWLQCKTKVGGGALLSGYEPRGCKARTPRGTHHENDG